MQKNAAKCKIMLKNVKQFLCTKMLNNAERDQNNFIQGSANYNLKKKIKNNAIEKCKKMQNNAEICQKDQLNAKKAKS